MKYASVLFLVSLLGRQMALAIRCNPSDYTDTEQKPMPDLFNYTLGSYEAIFDATIIKEKKTISIYEYKSIEQSMGSFYLADSGSFQRIIYYVNPPQMFHITYPNCMLVDIDEPPFKYWGWEDSKKGEYIYGPSAMLRMFNDAKKKYMERATVRGIIANHWQMCLEGGKVRLDIYFADEKWDTAFGPFMETLQHLPMPLRIIVDREATEANPSGSTSSMVVYDITAFKPFLTTWWALQTSLILDCPGRVSIDPNRQLPKIPNRFQISSEVITNSIIDGEHSLGLNIETVDNTKLWYNKDHKIIRYDFVPKKVHPPLQNKDPVSFIQDFNTGIEYVIDRVLGTCTPGPISDSTIGVHLGVGHEVVMAGPEEMFGLNDMFTYVTSKETRGLNSELWTATKSNVKNPVNDVVYKKAVVTYYFTEFNVEDEVTGEKSTHIPIRYDTVMYNNSNPLQVVLTVTSNLYDYVTVPRVQDSMIYDVRECYPNEADRKYLQIVFQGDFEMGVRQDPFRFKGWVLEKLLTYGPVSPVRISEINLDHDQKYIYVTCILLEKGSYLLEFTFNLHSQGHPGSNEKLIKDVNNGETCAKACVNEKLFYCKSFHFCKTKCFLSKTHKPDGNPLPGDAYDDCVHFVRNTDGGSSSNPPSMMVLANVMRAIANREFDVILSYMAGENPVVRTFQATDLHVFTPPDADPYKYMFEQWDSTGKLAVPEAAAEKIDFDECTERCATQMAFDCNSFSYCLVNKVCALSSSHPRELAASEYVNQGDCLLYGKRYLYNFVAFPGGISLQTSDKEVNGVNGTEACAYRCEAETSFKCKSFEYCAKNSVCALHRKHYYSTSSGEQSSNTGCTHYSRRNLADYKRFKHQRITGQHSKMTGIMGVGECANLCTEESGFVCLSFDVCSRCMYPDTCTKEERQNAECYISDSDFGDPGVTIESELNCDHYSRYLIDDQDKATWVEENLSSDDDSYTSGSMAGLAIGMLILGTTLTLGGILVFLKFGGRV